jgi:hypothetical protein
MKSLTVLVIVMLGVWCLSGCGAAHSQNSIPCAEHQERIDRLEERVQRLEEHLQLRYQPLTSP